MKTKEEILKYMQVICNKNNYIPTDKISNIASAKEMLLKENWIYCPCDSNNKSRYCGSKLCNSDIEINGICHCGCYKKNS